MCEPPAVFHALMLTNITTPGKDAPPTAKAVPAGMERGAQWDT